MKHILTFLLMVVWSLSFSLMITTNICYAENDRQCSEKSCTNVLIDELMIDRTGIIVGTSASESSLACSLIQKKYLGISNKNPRIAEMYSTLYAALTSAQRVDLLVEKDEKKDICLIRRVYLKRTAHPAKAIVQDTWKESLFLDTETLHLMKICVDPQKGVAYVRFKRDKQEDTTKIQSGGCAIIEAFQIDISSSSGTFELINYRGIQ